MPARFYGGREKPLLRALTIHPARLARIAIAIAIFIAIPIAISDDLAMIGQRE